ncbi:MAG: septum formation initiator family protein [bacterium]
MITKKRKTGKREFYQNLFFSILIGTFLFGTIGFLVISNLRISQKRTEMIERIGELQKEIQAVEEKNKNLKDGFNQIENESYWEEKAREQGYQKPGEETVVVLPPEEQEEVKKEEKSFWQNILGKIGF